MTTGEDQRGVPTKEDRDRVDKVWVGISGHSGTQVSPNDWVLVGATFVLAFATIALFLVNSCTTGKSLPMSFGRPP
jgi:hypothetical protein